MGATHTRTVEIQISNQTQRFTLENPRTYFFSGHSRVPPEPFVAPGSSSSCRFSNSTAFWGCNGVLAYEAQGFTLAIYFSNPIDHNLFSPELGLELSLDKVHLGDLKDICTRMVNGSHPAPGKSFVSHRVKLSECQEPAQVSLGPVSVTATMSNARDSVIRVVVEEQLVRMTPLSSGKDIQVV